MKNFLLIACQLGFAAFVMVAVCSILNWSFGWQLGFKGSEIPGDPVSAVAFLILGLLFGGAYLFMRPKA